MLGSLFWFQTRVWVSGSPSVRSAFRAAFLSRLGLLSSFQGWVWWFRSEVGASVFFPGLVLEDSFRGCVCWFRFEVIAGGFVSGLVLVGSFRGWVC